jgi:peptide/nickel transport system substrate-binding protein
MKNNGYVNIVATLLLLAVIFFGFAMVKSNDLKRLRLERVSKQLDGFNSRLKELDRKLTSISAGSARFAPKTESSASSPTGDTHPAKIANLRYFDSHADFGGRRISAISSETKNMNALVNNESLVSSIWSYCNDSLGTRDYAHPEKFEPLLAESWTVSEDKLTYSIKLRKGVYWQDFTDPVSKKAWRNVEVTAEDFKFYLDVIKNKDTDCAAMRTYLIDLDRIEVLSKYEFKVYWRKRYFLSESSTLFLSPLPRHLYHAYPGPFDGKKFNDDHERNRIVVGCGPYQFAGWEKGQRITLKRFDNYYGAKYGIAPPIETLQLEVIKHPNTQLQALLSGDIDQMSLQPDQWVLRTNTPRFEKGGDIRKIKYPARVYRYIGYNLRNALFKDRRVRVALTHLVNRKRIIKDVYHGLARIVTGNFFIGTPYNDKSVKPYQFSVAKAKRLFAEAGWSDSDGDGILDKGGVKFDFTMLAPSNSPKYDKILPIVKEDMAKAGVVLRIRKVEWSVFVQMIGEKKFETCILGWGMGFESDPYQLWHSSQADLKESSNFIGFKNTEADKLIEKIRVCFDVRKRIELCHKFHRLLHKEQPYTFLLSPDALTAQSARYKNVRVFPGGPEEKIMWVPKKQQKTMSR